MTEKWDRRFLALCEHVATWSKDPRTQVGAVLVKDVNREPILGYNGFPRGVSDTPERYNNREFKHQIVLHAERNAILTAKRDLKGYTLYCSLRPCLLCSCDIIQAEIARVVYPALTPEQEHKHENYRDEWALARELMLEAGIGIVEINLGENNA